MLSLYIWHYILVVPVASVEAADAVAPDLNNPDGIEATFLPYPEDIPTHWVASFVATENTPNTPSKVALEGALASGDSALGNILWVRSVNREHPNRIALLAQALSISETESSSRWNATNKSNKTVAVVAKHGWGVFNAGDLVDMNAVIAALP